MPDSPSEPSSAQRVVDSALSALVRFLHIEAVSGVVLLLAAAVALIAANSPLAASYEHLWNAPIGIDVAGYTVARSLHFLVNEALMTVFFLVVGMEIRREMHDGALAGVKLAALPLAAAFGGVLVPAGIYLAMNTAPPLSRGWAVPTATDIAFAVGVLALLGRSMPGAIRVFLLAIAIVDDIVAVVVIATFYASGLDYVGFLIAGGGVLVVLGLRRIGVDFALAYVVPGAIVWFGLLQAGVHPTLAGVVLGLLTPVVARGRAQPAVIRVREALHPWVAYAVIPLFALANAGVSVGDVDFAAAATQGVLRGVVVALVLGKPIGIVLATALVVRAGWCRLPPELTWRGVVLAGALAGIGFTMSVFIANLAFADPTLLAAAKAGVLAGSAVAGVAGLALGVVWRKRLRATESAPA
jgi:Na+:H+ antiporter, NhaA family